MIRGVTSEVLCDGTALAEIEREWWALWRRIPTATPFQSPAWLIPWWRAFSPGELRVIAVRWRENLVGLAPLYIEASDRGRRVLPLGISVSDYLDVLLHPEFAEVAGAAIARRLAREEWTCWEMPELAFGAAAWRVSCPAACDDVADFSSMCSWLALLPALDGVPAAIPRGKQRKIRMARNRADRCGGFDVVGADPENLQNSMTELMRLHALRWERRGEPGVLADPRVVAFHRAVAPRFLAAGLLRLYALRMAGETAAVFYGFHHAGRTYAYLTGFDPARAFVSPGTLIVAHAIEQAVREGAGEMDFLRGQEAFKQDWGTVPRENRRRIVHRTAAHASA